MASTLLLADGNPAIQRIVAMTFAQEDIDVVTVNDGEQAISRIASDKPDIVLADVATPKRNGYDVAAFVKGRPELAHIPVLLLSGAFEPVDEARAAEAGCDGVLVKPFEPQQVVARVLELVGGGKGKSMLSAPGVPRPIDRLMEARPAPQESPRPVPQQPLHRADGPRHEESPGREHQSQKVVKHPSAPIPIEPPAPPPQPAKKAVPPPDELDDYFDQLDAAFDNLEPSRPQPSRHGGFDEPTERIDVPTLSSVLGEPVHPVAKPPAREPAPAFKDEILFGKPPVDPPDIRPVPAAMREITGFKPVAPAAAPVEAPVEPVVDRVPVIDLPAVQELDLSLGPDPFDVLAEADRKERQHVEELERATSAAAGMSDEMIDAIATRVVERLAPNGIEELVSRIVSDVADRLVREEIDRIRGRK